MEHEKRKPEHQRKKQLEALLQKLNGLLGPLEQTVLKSSPELQFPPVFIVGVPRSGTTVFLQWLAATGLFAYPTNLLSRFYGAPYVGALIQQLLTDPEYSFGTELYDLQVCQDFESTLGKTKGALSPNEFWYFWRRFIPNTEIRPLSTEEEKLIDGTGLTAELAAMESAFEKPLAMKAMILQYNLPAFSALMNKALFVYIKRDLVFNVQSLLESREKFFGTREVWYSAKPAEFEELQGLDPVAQVVGQVLFTQRDIEAGLQHLPEERKFTIQYEAFCENPAQIYELLMQKLAAQGYTLEQSYSGVPQFNIRNTLRLSKQDMEALQTARQQMENDLHTASGGM